MDGMSVTLVESIDDLQAFFSWLGERRGMLAIDTETDGLRWWDGTLRMVQFGDANKGWAIPYEWWPKAITDALAQYTGPLVFHNAKFDLHWLERVCGFEPPWPRVHDSAVLVHLHEPHLRSGLKDAATRHIHRNAASGERVLKKAFSDNDWSWGTVPIDFPGYWKYAALDTILTARLADKLHPIVNSSRGELLDIEQAVAGVLYRMEKKGAMIDVPYTMATMDKFDSRVSQLDTWARTHYDVNLGSNQRVVTKLMGMGFEFEKLTKSGAIALDDLVLLEIMRDGTAEAQQFAGAIRSFRKLRKMSGTYLAKFLELADVNGHLHPSIRQLGAKTGRMSVATPSLQNLPRNEEVRSSFIPRAGNRLVLSDFDQIEIRILAHFSQDPGLIRAILGGDVHSTVARMIYNDPTIGKGDYRRQISKSAVFAKVYGAGVKKFALTAGISDDAAAGFMAEYDALFPGVPNFIGSVQAIARNRLRDGNEGWVSTPSGRRQTIGNEANDAYKLVNYLIQGTAADIMKTQLIALDNAGLGEYMVLPIHDEVMFDVPTEMIDDVGVVIQREMPITSSKYTVPISSDFAVVNCWGEKYVGQNSWIDEAFEDAFAEEIGTE